MKVISSVFSVLFKTGTALVTLSKSFEDTGESYTNFVRLTHEAAFELEVKVQLRNSIVEREHQPALTQLTGALLCWQLSIQPECCWTDPTHIALCV